VWEAWQASGTRCGRWSALRRLGAKLGATSKPERIQPYSPPPFIVRNVGAAMGGYQRKPGRDDKQPETVEQRALAALMGSAEPDQAQPATVTPLAAARGDKAALLETMKARYPEESQKRTPWQAKAELTRMAQPQPLRTAAQARAELTAMAEPAWASRFGMLRA
jgi:hypothetical protein